MARVHSDGGGHLARGDVDLSEAAVLPPGVVGPVFLFDVEASEDFSGGVQDFEAALPGTVPGAEHPFGKGRPLRTTPGKDSQQRERDPNGAGKAHRDGFAFVRLRVNVDSTFPNRVSFANLAFMSELRVRLRGPTVRIALVSDTHATVDDRVARAVRPADMVVHAGDIGSAAVLQQLRGRRPTVAVTGNNDTPDKWSEEDLPTLEKLPPVAIVELPGGLLRVEHGHRVAAKERHRKLRRRHADARVVVYGHSHRLVVDDEEEPWVVNPGASGRVRTHGGPSFLWLHASVAGWELRVERFAFRPRRRQ